MNPQLYQSIQLMTLPLAELKFRIQEEVERNPALEIIEDRSEVSLDDVQKTRSDDEEYYDEIRETSYIKSGGEEASDARQKFIEVCFPPESLQDLISGLSFSRYRQRSTKSVSFSSESRRERFQQRTPRASYLGSPDLLPGSWI
jgi:DNA-directed RNA polymerase specialized sigma54-like protein